MVMKQNRQVNRIIFQTVKKQKILSVGILCAVVGAVVAALIPPLILAKMIDRITAGKDSRFWNDPIIRCHALAHRSHGICKGKFADHIWTEDDTCAAQQSHGEIYSTHNR